MKRAVWSVPNRWVLMVMNVFLLSCGISLPVLAEETSTSTVAGTVPILIISASPSQSSASSTEIPAAEIGTIPEQLEPADALRTVPGLLISQHSGAGKANEYFLRGFDADHGTDIQFSADGIPLNLTGNAHGQGYTDLHFLIPETLGSIDVKKGPYDPEQGDFGTAGSISLKFLDKLPENFVGLTGGSFGTGRLAAGVNLPGVLSRSYFALEGYRTDGPFSNPENYKRLNLFWKGTQDFSPSSKLTILATSFESSWYGSGLLPSRAVEEGLISQWDSIDPSQGGKTERQNLSATYHSEIADGQNLEVQAYYTRYILQLFSNFTFFLNNPANGDGIEQDDNRNMFGGHVQYTGMVPLDAGIWTTTVGLESRNDENHPDLWNEEDRERISPILLSDTWERTLGIYVKEEVPLTSRLRFVGGLRYDHGNFDANGASGTDAIISPKGNLIFAASPNMDLFVNAGSGYHSNDPRTVATDPSSGFVRAVGLETGAQVRTLEDRLTASLAFWGMDVDSELVFDGDTGTTEPSGPSRRMGIENEWSYQLNRWLHADLDINLADAKYRGTDGSVPLAMNQYFTGGLTAHSNSGLEGSLRFRDVGRRWGDDDRQVPIEGYAVVDTMVSYRRGHWGYQLAVDNIADTTWRDGQFVYLSQLKSDPAPVTDVIFTPGNPRTILGSVKYFF